MKNHKLENICLGILAGAAFIVVAVLITLAAMPPKVSYKGHNYSLKCVVELRKNPLAECKEGGTWKRK